MQPLELLGKPIEQLTAQLGKPFCEYTYRGHDVLMFDSDLGTISCEVKEGLVKSIDNHKDRRTAVRSKPDRVTPVFLRYKKIVYEATIIDMSIKSVAMRVTNPCPPSVGSSVSFCTSLRTRARQSTSIVLSGKIYRIDHKNNTVVVLLHTPFETQSHRVLENYINTRNGIAVVGAAASPPPLFHRDEFSEWDVDIVKSDLCALCAERVCGLIPSYSSTDLSYYRGNHAWDRSSNI